MNHIPFGGGAQAATALLGGHIDCQVGSMMSVGPHILGGGLRALAVLGRERLSELPDVPTCLEKGYDVDRGFWHYLAMKKGTSPSVLNVMQNVFYKTADDSQVKATLTRAGYIPIRLVTGETTKKVKEEFDLAKEVFTKLGLK
jgi:tripartite-type tricarboxylate transporter receptor subunit TctC